MDQNRIDYAKINENKNKPDYFVILPKYKKFVVPGLKKTSKVYREFDVEDESLAPNSEDYFSIGYIPKPDYYKQLNEEGKEQEKDMTKPANITKHYRRIFRNELEMTKELHLRSPFSTAYLRRGKEEDKTDESCLFSLMTYLNTKIYKIYNKNDDLF